MTHPTRNLLRNVGVLSLLLSAGCGDVTQPEASSMAASVLPSAMDEALAPSAPDAPLERTTSVSLERPLGDGVTMRIGGTVSVHRGAPDAASAEVDVDLTRDLVRDGASAVSAQITGHLAVALGEGGVRTLTGELAVDVTTPRGSRQGTITLAGVVQDPRDACAWPVAGTMTRTSGDQSHQLVFDASCGKATLDGETVDLDELSSRGGRGGRAGRPR